MLLFGFYEMERKSLSGRKRQTYRKKDIIESREDKLR